VPQLSMERRDILRRFISLIDSVYYNHRNLIIESDVPIESLFNIKEAGHDK
jgi:peroxisome-assembly ATPase